MLTQIIGTEGQRHSGNIKTLYGANAWLEEGVYSI